MTLLILGLVVFFGLHLYSTFRTRQAGASIVDKLGTRAYMGAYSLVSALGLVLIAFGYASAPVGAPLYLMPFNPRGFTVLGMAAASICLASAYAPPNHIARTLKHPMLTGVVLWAAAHLLSRGHGRDLALFGPFLVFSLLNIVVVNRRAVASKAKTAPPTLTGDAVAVAAGLAGFTVIALWLHAAVLGVRVMG
jgi:uncharacterized membrane protein